MLTANVIERKTMDNMDTILLKTEYDLNLLPSLLLDNLDVWKKIILETKNMLNSKEPQEWCPEKYAKISFTFEGKKYILYPQALNVDDTLFYYASKAIISCLESVGMEDIKYAGMID